MLASAAAVTRPAATTRVVVASRSKMGQRLSKKNKNATTTAASSASSASSASDEQTDDASSTRVMTSADLSRWIAARGSTVELIHVPGNDTPDVASSAAALGVSVDCIVKSLAFNCDGEFIVVVTNGEARVDAKKIAHRLNLANKRVRLASPTVGLYKLNPNDP
jgi:hypothetical protein